MHKLRRLVLVGLAVAALPAVRAALQFTEVSSFGFGSDDTKIQVLIEGDHVKATILENRSEFPPAGSYMLGTAGGQMYLVLPANQAYTQFDRSQLAGMGQQGTDSMKQARAKQQEIGMTSTVENYRFEKVLDEAGPRMFGYPTRHYRYVLSYKEVMHMKGAPRPMTTTYTEQYEFWATKAIGELSKAYEKLKSMHARPTDTGDEAANKVAEAERVMADQGFALKSIHTHKVSQGGMMGFMSSLGRLGRSHDGGGSVSKDEIVALAQVDAPRDAFELPKDFQEVDMMSLFTAAGGQMPNLNSMPGGKQRQAPPQMPDLNSQ